MSRKVLVITIGTAAAMAGQKIRQQVTDHSNNKLRLMVRFIDTAYLPNRYGTLHNGEWFQVTIGRRYMEALYKRIKEFPRVEAMLFPGLLPETAATGSSQIRYNGAAAVEIQREALLKWLGSSMKELVQDGDSETRISVILVASATGGTGSGALERLLDIITEAAQHFQIVSPEDALHCDMYILQPGQQDVSELELANTFALYAELAASQLAPRSSAARQYRGRKVIVGWGKSRVFTSLDQLIEETATLVRLSINPTSSLPAELQEQVVDNHVLHELDPISSLPMHLSAATAITISARNLAAQVIQHDATALIEELVFSKRKPKYTVLLNSILRRLKVNESYDIYTGTIDHFATKNIKSKISTLDIIAENQFISICERSIRLKRFYQGIQNDILQSESRVQNEGKAFVREMLSDIELRARELLIVEGLSLSDLREEYITLEAALKIALEVVPQDSKAMEISGKEVDSQVKDLRHYGLRTLFNRRKKLRQLTSTMKQRLQAQQANYTRDTTLTVLEELYGYCIRTKQNLDAMVAKLSKQRVSQEGWAAVYRVSPIEKDHPMHLMAFSTPDEIKTQMHRISIFNTALPLERAQQTAKFRQWMMLDEERVAMLFAGDAEQLVDVANDYTRKKVTATSSTYKLIDALISDSKDIFRRRLREATDRAVSLVAYDSLLAPGYKETWYVMADYSDAAQREELLTLLYDVSQVHYRVLKSDDPDEIAIFYVVDGIPMSAIDDLRGRCLQAFLKRRQQWGRQRILLDESSPMPSIGNARRRVGIPVYSGRDAEGRVLEKGIARRLYEMRGQDVEDHQWEDEDLPELRSEAWQQAAERLLNFAMRSGIPLPLAIQAAQTLSEKSLQESRERDQILQVLLAFARLSLVELDSPLSEVFKALDMDWALLMCEHHTFNDLFSLPATNATPGPIEQPGMSLDQLRKNIVFQGHNHQREKLARQSLSFQCKGEILAQLERYSEALSAFDQALHLASGTASLYKSRGDMLMRLGRYQEALSTFDQALRLAPGTASLYKSKSDILTQLGRYQEALSVLDQNLDVAAHDASLYRSRGNILLALLRNEEALSAYEQALGLDSDDALALYNKGVVLERLDRYEEALTAYQRAMELDPNSKREGASFSEGVVSLPERIKTVQRFFARADFALKSTPNLLSFLAIASPSTWHDHFSKNVYIHVLFDNPLDANKVQYMYEEAKTHSDYGFVIINKQPTLGGWMAITMFRARERDSFTFLPVEEAFLKECIVLNRELRDFRTYLEKHIGKAFDPYNVRGTISDAMNFFGRESFIDERLEELKQVRSVGLFGLHKMGKSSALRRLQKKAAFPVSHVFLSKGDSLATIYQRILDGWSLDVRIKYPVVQWYSRSLKGESDSKMIFESAAKDLLHHLDNVMKVPLLAIFLDEIEKIVPNKEGDEQKLELYISLMDSLRGLQQETNSLSIVVAGVHTGVTRYNYFWGDQKNPMYMAMTERFLHVLDKKDCKYMIRSLGQQISLAYDEQALDDIIQMSGAHPFLARQICSIALKRNRGTDTISKQSIQKVVQNFGGTPIDDYFGRHGLWNELGRDDVWEEGTGSTNRQLLRLLAASESGLTEAELYTTLDKQMVRRSLAALTDLGIIEMPYGSDTYHIIFGIFRTWIRLHELGMEE